MGSGGGSGGSKGGSRETSEGDLATKKKCELIPSWSVDMVRRSEMMDIIWKYSQQGMKAWEESRLIP